MILGYEEPVLMPTMDIYSTDLMKMYIEGVREQYKEGLDEYKDFMKQYQDFYSSLPGANEYWYNNTIKPAQDLIAQASSQGIDLFKSPEGRAAIRNMVNSVPLGKLKQVQAASEDYDKYLDSVGKLQEQGKYNPAFQDFILNLMYPGGYQLVDSNGNINPWKTRSATPYEDMTEYTAPWFEGMKDSYLGSTPDGRYNLIGINDDAMRPILDQNMADYMSSPLGQFHFQQFANTLPPGTTPELAFNAFLNEIMAKNRRIQHVEREADPYAKDDHSTANEILKDRKRQALQHYYHTLEQGSDGNGNGKRTNAQYSHYVAIDQASGGIIEKLSGISRGIDQESGNAVYYVTKADGTNLLVTEKDAQNIAIQNANRNLTGTKHVFDILAAEDVSALPNAVLSDTMMEDDVVDWSKLKSKIYSKNSVDMSSGHQNLVVRGDLPNEVLRRIITNTDSEKGILYNGVTYKLSGDPKSTNRSAAIWEGGGVLGIYTEYEIPVTKIVKHGWPSSDDQENTTVKFVLKCGEYEIEPTSGQKVPSAKWSTYMNAQDKSVSSTVMGNSKGVTVTNVIE